MPQLAKIKTRNDELKLSVNGSAECYQRHQQAA